MNRKGNVWTNPDPLRNSSQNDLTVLSSKIEENKYLECEIHPKQEIFMYCLNHGPRGICDECWNTKGDPSVCSQYRQDCDCQSIKQYIRYNFSIAKKIIFRILFLN